MTLTRRIFEEKRRLIYPVVVALVLNLAVMAAVVYPLSRKVANGEESAQAAATALRDAQRDHESAKNTVTGKVAADTELKKFYGDVLPPDQSAARRITYLRIIQLAEKVKVNYTGASSDATRVHDSGLGKLSTTVRLSGEYAEIRHFIYELETTPDFLILESVALSQGSEKATALNVTVRVATYYQAGADGT